MVSMLLIATTVITFQATTVVLSTGFHELGFPPIARIDYEDHIPAEPRLRYGFFLTIGFVSFLSFVAGRLSHSKPSRDSNVG